MWVLDYDNRTLGMLGTVVTDASQKSPVDDQKEGMSDYVIMWHSLVNSQNNYKGRIQKKNVLIKQR